MILIIKNKTYKYLNSNKIFNIGKSAQDMYAVGDLSGKLDYLKKTYWDIFLPLSGPNSVQHRTLAIYR